ncbi:MAG TPA: trypsin-like peptidase domain-containing protein [Candidatus Paceibacterota bacterium]|jgi:S1-C subfamily serine protease|nr:trypsin-like peptidase domain-containing protein [Candidatus Paceibacterota bacterium]
MDDKAVVKVVKRVMPAVVSIAIAKRLADLEKEKGLAEAANAKNGGGTRAPSSVPMPTDFALMADERGMVQVGGGSGFVVDPNGLIMTNKHVISDSSAEYTVILNDGRKFTAEILSRDPINDVAILKINVAGLPCLKLGDATKLELGQSLIAIGNALGVFKNTVSLGIVSGLSRSIMAQAEEPDGPAQEMRGLIQTDAAINPGNSGGPLVDRDGLVVAVNAAIVSGAQSIGFAIPVNAARRDLDDIKKFGRIRRPLLGIRYLMIDARLKQRMGLPVDYGALVVRESEHDYAVVPASSAEKAGVKEHDIILEFNGKKLDHDHPVQDFLEDMNVGDSVELTVLKRVNHADPGTQSKVKLLLTERK